jgi:microsomal dipeptidase-like Zn-dependent dipeptidase
MTNDQWAVGSGQWAVGSRQWAGCSRMCASMVEWMPGASWRRAQGFKADHGVTRMFTAKTTDDVLQEKIDALTPEVRELHFGRACPVDLHLHPLMSLQLFGTQLGIAARFWRRFAHTQAPWIARASFPALRYGGWQVVLANAHTPEPELKWDLPLAAFGAALGRLLGIGLTRDLFARDTFSTVRGLMNGLERALAGRPAWMFWRPNWRDEFKVIKSPGELHALLIENSTLTWKQRRTAVIHAVEGGHALNPQSAKSETDVLDKLEALHARGVAYMVLTHFYDNDIAPASHPFPDRVALMLKSSHRWWNLNAGLSKWGPAVVKRMLELGMLIDMTHCTPRARAEVMTLAEQHLKHTGKLPGLMMTHVGARAMNPTPYNPSDDEVRRIADLGGVVGVIWMQYWLAQGTRLQALDAVAQTLMHLRNVGGDGVAAIGTDLDGLTHPPEDLRDATDLPRLTDRLLAENLPEAVILKMLGRNALRVLLRSWRHGVGVPAVSPLI